MTASTIEVASVEQPVTPEPVYHNLDKDAINSLREQIGMMMTRTYYMISRANPDLHFMKKEEMALDLIQTLIKEAR